MKKITLLSILASAMLLTTLSAYSLLSIKKGEKIVFFGDSITQLGNEPGGYVTLVRDTMASKYKDFGVEVIGAGISGNKVPDLQARLEKDVLSKNPTTVVIYIGINDVWHYALGIGGTPKEKFEAGLKDIIGKITSKGARVILCTPSVVGERSDSLNKNDAMLNEYSDISRRVARETKSQLLDLRQAFLDYELKNNPKQLHEGVLTRDAVHMNAKGNKFLAGLMLKALLD
ncbi:MAG: SGNH/GDSL hydrolase family protein [Ignavibacteria bacterium]|jgi:lysophospholipase L1-like esterase|nr:SGNH/GDSL hydrolase family protein [Ignavibacteria bacterium]MCU7503629.1 SGNH/GDSL hydrolase family protein [Ignavibacteria bacterium]MCU7517888.1 SGNH/GDSL hydrolase family protein [Ignavibacteria bacterium]